MWHFVESLLDLLFFFEIKITHGVVSQKKEIMVLFSLIRKDDYIFGTRVRKLLMND